MNKQEQIMKPDLYGKYHDEMMKHINENNIDKESAYQLLEAAKDYADMELEHAIRVLNWEVGEVNLNRVYNFAQDAHSGQTRKDGKTPYFRHPVQVHNLLVKWGVKNTNILAAALLHDVLEDTDVTGPELKKVSNGLVLDYVLQLTHHEDDDKMKYIREFANKNLKSTEVVLIKVADRFCNTLDFVKSNQKYAVKYWKKGEPILEGLRAHAYNCAYGDGYPGLLPALQKANKFVEGMYQLIHALDAAHLRKREVYDLLK